jgi:hypothetical protein
MLDIIEEPAHIFCQKQVSTRLKSLSVMRIDNIFIPEPHEKQT